MKESEAAYNNHHKIVMYVEKEDGSYGPKETGSYMIDKYEDDNIMKRENLFREFNKKISEGEISSVGYYMIILKISDADLAVRTGIGLRRVRKHKTVSGFSKAALKEIVRYAEVFGIPVANMFQILVPKKPDKPGGKVQEKTKNPMVVKTYVHD